MTKAQFIEANIKDVCTQYANGMSKRQLAKEYNVTLGYFLQLWENFEYRGLISNEVKRMHESSKNDARTRVMREKKYSEHSYYISYVKSLGIGDAFTLACKLNDEAALEKCIQKVAEGNEDAANYIRKNISKVYNALNVDNGNSGYTLIARNVLCIDTVKEFVETFGGYALDSDRIAGIEYVLNTLYPREAEVIKIRYLSVPTLTLEQTGKRLGLSRERVRQIESKAMRKLRHNSRYVYIKFGYNGTIERMEQRRKERERELAARRKLAETNPVAYAKSIKINDLQMSVRLYNCLVRADIQTLGDIKSMEQLRSIRNMGTKTIDEAQELLKSYGLIVN